MHIIVNVIDPTGLASTGTSSGFLYLLAGAIALVLGLSALQHFVYARNYANAMPTLSNGLKRQGGGLKSAVLVLITVPALIISTFSFVTPANAATATPADTVTINVTKGTSATQTGSITVAGLNATTVKYQLLGQLQQALDSGIALKVNDVALDHINNNQFAEEAATNLTHIPTFVADVSADVQAEAYEYDLNLTTNEIAAVVPPTPPTPLAPGRVSVNNVNFYDEVTNFAGGDLIINDDASATEFSSAFYSDYAIKIGGVACTTTGEGFVEDGSAEKIGCVIPKLGSNGIYAVTVSVSGGSDLRVGELNYQALPAPFSACTTLQTFASNNCKGSLVQGQSILLEDARGGADIGFGANNYRVKKMPDGNVWMIDNLAIDPTNVGVTWDTTHPPLEIQCTDYYAYSGCTPFDALSEPTWTKGAYGTGGTITGSSHSYGYLYNWCFALADVSPECTGSNNALGTELEGVTGISPMGWRLPTNGNGNSGQFMVLANAMRLASATNPVYGAGNPSIGDGQANWGPDGPWQGVYSGRGVFNPSTSTAIASLGSWGFVWSSTAFNVGGARSLDFYGSGVRIGAGSGGGKGSNQAVRAVL